MTFARHPERSDGVLCAVIEEFIRTGRPVSSQQLARCPGLPWSSATLRSEMAGLEVAGWLSQPHTSAGRCPTEMGLRYYVKHLLEPAALQPEQKVTIQREITAVISEGRRLLHYVSRLLSSYSHGAGLVIQRGPAEFDWFVTGQENFLDEPELSRTPQQLKKVFVTLEDEGFLHDLSAPGEMAEAVTVRIGSEIASDSLTPLSLIGACFGRPPQGTVAVVGPRWMDYRQVIPLVDFTAHLLGQTMPWGEVQ